MKKLLIVVITIVSFLFICNLNAMACRLGNLVLNADCYSYSITGEVWHDWTSQPTFLVTYSLDLIYSGGTIHVEGDIEVTSGDPSWYGEPFEITGTWDEIVCGDVTVEGIVEVVFSGSYFADSEYLGPINYVCDCCALAVDKKCFVAPSPSDPFVCSDAKPIDSLTMRWAGTQTIRVKAYKGSVGSTLLADIDNIAPGDEVTISGMDGSPNDQYWEVYEAGTDIKIGESTFHISCSDDDMNGPEDCGKPQGDGKAKTGYLNLWIFEGMSGELILDCTPLPAEPTDNCEFIAPTPPDCETMGKPQTLTFKYTGADCSASNNDQASDKWDCTGLPGGDPVSITIIKDPAKITVNPSTGIMVGDLVTVSAIGSDMGSEIKLNVGDQYLKIHTSCSQPLEVGDVFGSLELVAFDDQYGGAEVTYFYEVTNIGGTDVDVISVSDNMLGELLDMSPITLAPAESFTIEEPVMITETIENTVTVSGNAQGTTSQCTAQDDLTVTVQQPPPCVVNSDGYSIGDNKFEWKLVNNSNKVVTIESIAITWPDALGCLKKVKRDKDTIWEGLRPPPSTVLISTDFINNVDKRQIKPDDDRKIKFEFVNNATTAPGDYTITVNFEEGCSITFVP